MILGEEIGEFYELVLSDREVLGNEGIRGEQMQARAGG